jgi:flagellar biosynthesis GTPase FlhF
MSTTTAEPAIADAPVAPAPIPELRTYRGRTLEELLPKIRDELGPDAIVVRQRDGLMGGIGGFFQQRFVEIEARRGHRRVDVYDEPPAAEDFAAQLAAAEEQAAEPLVTAPFADALPQAAAPVAPLAPDPRPEPAAEPAPPVPDPLRHAAGRAPDFASALPVAARPDPAPEPVAPQAAAAPEPAPALAAEPFAQRATEPPAPAADHPELVAALVAHGVSDPFARELVADAAAHLLPLMGDGDARAAVAAALTRRIPLAPLAAGNGHAVAFVGAPGAGKTRCAAALAAAHAQAGRTVRVVALDADDDGAELTRLLAPHGVEVQPAGSPGAARAAIEEAPAGALVVLDAPAVSPGDAAAVARLAGRLGRAGAVETHVALPATLSAAAAHEQLDRFAPLKPSALTLTHADATDHIGAIVELACTSALPLAYVADGRALPGGLTHPDPAALAERLLR